MSVVNLLKRKLTQPHIALAGLLSIITATVITQHFNHSNDEIMAERYDVFVTHPHYMWTDNTGEMRGDITAETTQYNSKNGVLQMTKPQLKGKGKDQQTWQLNADHGKSLQHHAVIHLWDNVILKQKLKPETPPTIVQTRSLTVYPYQQRAHTDEEVTLVQQSNRIESKGITIDLKSGTIHLLSKARGKYENEND